MLKEFEEFYDNKVIKNLAFLWGRGGSPLFRKHSLCKIVKFKSIS